MRSIRTQFFSIITALLLILLILLNTYPVNSARNMVFEEKKNAMSGQAYVISTSLSGLDRLSPTGIREVLQLLDTGNYARTVVTDPDGSIIFDDHGKSGIITDISDIHTALSGKSVFRSAFEDGCFRSGYAIPLYNANQITGALYISEMDYERALLITDLQKQIRSISVIIIAAAVAVMFAFTSVLLQRVKALVSSMKNVASGDYAYRHTVHGADELSELGNEFNKLTERLETNEKQRRRFVADASHELKTPVASIRLLSDSIMQSENMDRETVREFVSDIGAEAFRLQRTTEKLLDLSRLDDKVQVIPEPVDVKQVAQDALALIKPLADEQNIRFISDLDDGCVVMATTDIMFHILSNLIENAVKYNVPGGSVTVRAHSDESSVKIYVEDTGIGIPEEDRLNIFTRFYRVDKARSREAGGSGLGLSIVHDAVISYGGTIAVGPNKPNGSLFIVSFPRPKDGETGI